MARPQKQTVDYFPHQVGNGKTKLVLQNEFGNDGYAFWYQLLELLCVSDNQVYDYNNPASWRLLLAQTHVTEDNATKILQLLADLGALDAELHKNKIIWSQNLIENLELVYKRRATGTPEKPVIANKNPIKVNNNRQTKLNNTKLNNTKLNNTKHIIPDYLDKELWDDFLEMRKKLHKPATDKAKHLLIEELEKLRIAGDDPNEVLKQSIKNSYLGLFPLKEGKNGAYQQSSRRNPRSIPKPRDYISPEEYGKRRA